MKLLCFAMFACAFNLLLGYTKMLSFGHAAYFGASAYVTGWLTTVQGWGTIEGILGGVAVAMLLGLLIGAIAVRRQGIYFAMITLALAQVVYFICLQAQFTGGENGLQGIPRGTLFRRDRPWQRSDDVLLRAGGLCRCVRLHSPHRALTVRPGAQSHSRQRAARHLVGIQRSTATSSRPSCCRRVLPGLAGSLKALVLGFAHAVGCESGYLGEVILMTLLGGSGTFLGRWSAPNVVVTPVRNIYPTW